MKRLAGILALSTLATVLMLPLTGRAQGDGNGSRFALVEATIEDIQKAVQTHLITSEQLVQMYLNRIAAYDVSGPHLNSYMRVNPNALGIAHNLDETRHPGHARLPLDGIPVVVKDNIDTADVQTTAGSVALDGSITPDAFITRKLRDAGAIVIGKGTLTEFANFLTNGMPAGYSSQLRRQLAGDVPSLLGYGFNGFHPRTDPRPGFDDGRPALSPGGSSSGPAIAVSANLATVGVGTETSGSILSPGTQNLVVGIKPTVGLVSRDGIVPITADQDTAGPFARTVTDAAILLGVLAGHDPNDPATAACLTPGNCFDDYTQFLDRRALRGARIFVPYFSYWTNTADPPVVNLSPSQLQVMNDAIAAMEAEGAYVERGQDFPAHDIPTQTQLNMFGGCGTHGQSNCTTVLLYGFKRDLNAYFANHPAAPVHSLAEVIAYNNAHSVVALKYGQVLAVQSDLFNTDPGSADTLRYLSDRTRDLELARGGLDAVYNGPDGIPGTDDDFDAILFPANRGANIAARAGYPSLVLPGGFVANTPTPDFPPGFNALPAPYGVTLSGRPFSEGRLIGLAYALEQATGHRQPPASAPPLPTDVVTRH